MKIDINELEVFAKDHTIADIKGKYGSYGYYLCLKHKFSYIYKEYVHKDEDVILRKQRIEQDIKNGLSLSTIARIYNCSRQYVFSLKEQLDI